MRIEAAHIIASISYGTLPCRRSVPLPPLNALPGSDEALRSLLKAQALNSLLIALSKLAPSDPPILKSAIARALRVLAVAIAEAVGPSQWGLQHHAPDTQRDPKDVLDTLFEVLCASFSRIVAAALNADALFRLTRLISTCHFF